MSKKNKLFSYSNGKPECTVENIIRFINNEPKYAGKLKLNTFTSRYEFDGKKYSDRKATLITNDVERALGFYNPIKVRGAIEEIFSYPENQYNPVEDYLKGLAWDGNKRIEQMFTTWLKADDTRLNRAYAMKWMRAGVRRILEPGCKFDNVVVLKGDQGIGKSIFCKRLSAGFGTVNIKNIEDPEKYLYLLNKNWICVLDELRSLKKYDTDTIKTFFSAEDDEARLAYERESEAFKRHCIFIGSTNDDTFLNDYSQMTERRFWVVDCKAKKDNGYYVFNNFTKDVVDQLWAEAYYLYKKDPNYDLELEPDLYSELEEEQKMYKSFSDDPTYEFLKDILTRKYPSKEFQYNQFRDMVEKPSEYNGVYEIERIPVRFINNILSESRCASSRSAAWLKTVMEDLGWKKTSCLYKATDKKEMCWKKIDSDGLFNDEE